jgi:chromosome segregation ATPase
MSQIINLVQNLQEIFKYLNKINESIKDDKLRLEADPNEIFDAMESFKTEKKGNIEKIRINKDEIESLKSKIFQLSQDIPKLESEVQILNHKRSELERTYKAMNNKLAELGSEKQKYAKDIEVKTEILSNLESELNNSWKKVEEEIQEISRINDKIDQDKTKLKEDYNQVLRNKEEILKEEIEKIEIENNIIHKQKLVELNSLKLKIKALNMLIDAEMINTELFKFIKALQKNKEMELAFFCQTINLDPAKAEQIVKKIVSEGGPIKFEENSGMIVLEKEVGF